MAPSYEAKRGTPKAEDGCASKRHPSTQRSVCQLCKAPLRIVIGSEAVGSLLNRMRINAQEEKRKHGITCDTSSPLETGVLQRDSRVWLHPKRRLACPLGRLPMKPNGARRRRRMDVPRRGTILRSGQYDNSAKHCSVSSTEAKSRELCRARMRVNAQEEK